MKISVIVPVYNVRDYIIRCLDSLINQTFKDFEIILVNDGTTDDSIKLVEEKYDDARIKIIYKKNGGLARARNSGVCYARGEYLYFLDSDDFLEKTALEEMYKVAKKGNYDIVYTDYYKYFDENNCEEVSLISHFDSKNLKSLVTAMPAAWSRLIKRELFLNSKIKFLEGYYFEDNAIIPLLAALAKNPYYLRKPLYYYVQREGSILNQGKYNSKWEDIFYVLEHLKSKFEEYNLLDSYKEELEYIYIEYLLHASNLRFITYKEGNPSIKKVAEVIKNEFPKYNKNKYYKEESLKYKIVCFLFYHKQIKLLKLILKVKDTK